MTKLSVNINKIASLRNARGGNMPNLLEAAIDCQKFGAEGITVHPRPDERHIRYQDVRDLRAIVNTEFNIEGYPSDNFLKLVTEVKPEQITLVPDAPDVITSNSGWDTVKHFSFLKETIKPLKKRGIRISIFTNTDLEIIKKAKELGTDRIELYTEPYASAYKKDKYNAVKNFVTAAQEAKEIGLEVNAGHDLNLENLRFFAEQIPFLKEVSIGHALICDALYLGLENTIRLYLQQIKSAAQKQAH